MNQALTTASQLSADSALPALLDPIASSPHWLVLALEALDHQQLSRPLIPSHRAPTAEQRDLIGRMIERLTSRLQPAADQEIAQAAAVVRACMKARNPDAASGELEAMGFILALRDLPAWAIQEAAARIVRGDAGLSKIYAPTPAEFREVAGWIAVQARWHKRRLEMLLAAEVVGPEARAQQVPQDVLAFIASGELRKRPGNPSGVNHADK